MKRAILVAIAALLFAVGAQAEPYDLRGFKLGMSLDEFRAMPYPDPGKYRSTSIRCSSDPGAGQNGGSSLQLYGTEAKIGITRCNYFRPSIIESLAQKGWVDEANLDVANVGVYQSFDFFPDSADGVPRLYRILIRSNMDYWDQFYGAYMEKFGKPSRVTNSKVQNQAGGTFNKVTATWDNKDSSITLEQRTGKVNLMGITYLHHALGAQVVRQVEAIEGKPSSKL